MEDYIPAQSYVGVCIRPWYIFIIASERKDHAPIRTRVGFFCGICNWRGIEHIQRRQKHEYTVHCFCLVGYQGISINSNRRWWTGTNYKPNEDGLHKWVYHLWKWQWQGRTKPIMLLLIRPNWLRKNQTIWQHVIPWSLKEFCLLKGQTMQKMTRNFTWKR